MHKYLEIKVKERECADIRKIIGRSYDTEMFKSLRDLAVFLYYLGVDEREIKTILLHRLGFCAKEDGEEQARGAVTGNGER